MANYKLNNKTVDHLDPGNVGACIGYYGGDYYTVCTHDNINPKSKHKPVPSFVQVKGSGTNGEMSDEERKANNYGNVVSSFIGKDCGNTAVSYTNSDKYLIDYQAITYSPKYLGSETVKYARILDFNGYDHNAGDGCTVSFTQVKIPIRQSAITITFADTFVNEIKEIQSLEFAKNKQFGILIKPNMNTTASNNSIGYCNIDILNNTEQGNISINISTIDLVRDGNVLYILPVFTDRTFSASVPTLVSTLDTQATFKAFACPYTKMKSVSIYNPGPAIANNLQFSLADLVYSIEEPSSDNNNMRKLTITSCSLNITNNNDMSITLSSVKVAYCSDYEAEKGYDGTSPASYTIASKQTKMITLIGERTLSHMRGDGDGLIKVTYNYEYDGAGYSMEKKISLYDYIK